MPARSDFLFQGVAYTSPAAFNSAILGAGYIDSPPAFQQDSLASLANLPPPMPFVPPVSTSAGGGAKIAPDSWANGVCDRCSFVWELQKLRYQVVNRQVTSLRVCPNCYDVDNQQLWIGEVDTDDASVLRDARSDSAQRLAGRGVCGWNPVVMAMPLMVVIGKVTVTKN